MTHEDVFKREFVERMNRLADLFPGVNNKVRLPRIFSIVKDIPLDALDDIINALVDSSKSTPLPNDFRNAVTEWKKHYYLKHGRYYSKFDDGPPSIEIDVINCSKCNDLGMVYIKHRVPSDFEALMRCTCQKLTALEAPMPEWDAGLSGAFTVAPCPLEWFKPDISEDDTDCTINNKIWERVQFWKTKQRAAEKHWESLGFIKPTR